MGTYTIPFSLATQPKKACAALEAFLLHRVPWGKTIGATGITTVSSQFRVTITPDLTQAQIDHLMTAANGVDG